MCMVLAGVLETSTKNIKHDHSLALSPPPPAKVGVRVYVC